MSRLVNLIAIVGLAFVVIIIAIRMVGGLVQPVNPAQTILALGACEQPCWRGIYPGVTTLDQADALLNMDTLNVRGVVDVRSGLFGVRARHVCWTLSADPGWQGCAVRQDGAPGPVNEIYLTAPRDRSFSLGDAMAVLGRPVASNLCKRLGFMSASVYFSNNIEIDTFEDHPTADGRYDLHLQVFQVIYHYPADEPPYGLDTPRWRGLIAVRDLPLC